MDELTRRVRADIDTHGWHVGLVPPDEQSPSWAFTIGLLEGFDHPELCVFGLELETAHRLLNAAGLRIRRGERWPADGPVRGLIEEHACVLRGVHPRWVPVFFGNAAWHYQRDDVPFLQLFWPDPTGRHPWDAGFDARWLALQPRLDEAHEERALDAGLRGALQSEGAL